MGTYVHGRAVRETRVLSPSHSLARRELPRSLAFKKDDGLGESISVVVGSEARVVEVARRVVIVVEREGMGVKKSGGEERQKEEEERHS